VSVKDEMLFDFSVKMPRIMVSGNVAIIDYVNRVVSYSLDEIVLHTSKCYTKIMGKNLVLKEIRDERVLVSGDLESFEFLKILYKSNAGGE